MPNYLNPIPRGAVFEGYDQGVDYHGAAGQSLTAVGAGTIYKVSGDPFRGVYEHLDLPVWTPLGPQSDIYYAEAQPLWPVGSPNVRVAAGDPVAAFTPKHAYTIGGVDAGGWQSETGFARAGSPAGGVGTSTYGHAFADFIAGLGAPGSPISPPAVPGTPGSPAPGPSPSPPSQGGSGGCPSGQEMLCGGCHDPNARTGAAGFLHDCWAWETWGSCCKQDRPVRGAVNVGEAASKVLSKLGDPQFWIRVLEIVGGAVMVLVGVYLLARQIGLAAPAIGPVRSAAAAVA